MHSLWVNRIYKSSMIHITNESFNYKNFFLCDNIRFLNQLHENSCQSLFFLWFCPRILKFSLTLIKEWENNIAPCQCIKEWESSTCLRLSCSQRRTLHSQVDDMQSMILKHPYRQFLQRIVSQHLSYIGSCGEPASVLLQY